MTKQCSNKSKCVHGEVKQPMSNFYKISRGISKYSAQCKDCTKHKRDSKPQRNNLNWLKMIIG